MEKLIFLILFIALTSHGESWPQFRGPTGQGHIEAADLPLNWSGNEGSYLGAKYSRESLVISDLRKRSVILSDECSS